MTESVFVEAPSQPQVEPRVLHIYPCWELWRQRPTPGDRTLCGLTGHVPGPGVPYRGNEHLACAVCFDLR